MKFLNLFVSLIIFHSFGFAQKKQIDKKYKIAFNIAVPVSGKESNYEVFTIDMDGKNPQNITNHKDVAWTYYAYRNRLFFISDRDTSYRNYFLYECDVEGKQIRKVSNLRLEDSWMSSRKNGKELIVSGRIGKEVRYQLFIINTKTGKYRQITNDTVAMYRDPVFSPDGKKIVFAYQKNKRDKKQHEELFMMNVDGTAMKQLSHYPPNDTLINAYGYKAGPPRWHPTQNFITYQSQQAGKYSLYAVNPEGTKQWKLTDNQQEEGWHDWSNDGKWLAIELFDSKQSQFYIGLMNWETKELKVLTDTTYKYTQAPVFVELK